MSLYLGEYHSLRLVGEGAFATIRKVRHDKLGYVRALKVLNGDIDSEHSPAYQAFLKECKVLLKIGNGCHPNIVRIYQPRLIENRAVVEMDYVDGCTLNDYVQKTCGGFVDYDEFSRFVREIVGALAYCHVDIYRFMMNPGEDELQTDPNDAKKYIITPDKEKQLIAKYGVTHNDLHSNNIMRRDYDGSFVLLDFGLSIQNGQAVKSSQRTGGAVEYKSPEKWENDSVITPQSDIYSLGVLLYEVLAGRVPFVYDPAKYSSELAALNDMYAAHSKRRPPAIEPLRKAAYERTHPGQAYKKDYPDWVEAMIMKCLEKKPQKRYANAKELLLDYNSRLNEPANNKIVKVPDQSETSAVPVKKPQRKAKLLSRLKSRCYRMLKVFRRGKGRSNKKRSFFRHPLAILAIVLCLILGVYAVYKATEITEPRRMMIKGVSLEQEGQYGQAAEWYQKAADLGNHRAQYKLGNLFFEGKGVKQDYVEAETWYRMAAEQGDIRAQIKLGNCYGEGIGVKQDNAEAVKWYRMAAEQGIAEAQDSLAVGYLKGYGVKQDYAEAVKWFRKSAEQGNAYAQCNLGNCYEKGYGVKKDYNEALEWYGKAAESDKEEDRGAIEVAKKALERLARK